MLWESKINLWTASGNLYLEIQQGISGHFRLFHCKHRRFFKQYRTILCHSEQASMCCAMLMRGYVLVGDSNVLWQAVQHRLFLLPVCAAADTCLPEVAVTSSWTHYEDQVSMLSKCHSLAGEFLKISLFHQLPPKSIFKTGVKCYVHTILYILTSSEWRMDELCKYQDF